MGNSVGAPLSGKRILIVDDNAELGQLLASAVSKKGGLAFRVETGQEALAEMGEQTPDGAIVDLLLPDVRGSEVLDALRIAGVPAVAVSGAFKGDKHADEAVKQHGAVAFFEKPFAVEDVVGALTRALGVLEPAEPALPFDEAVDALGDVTITEDEPTAPYALASPPPEPRPAKARERSPSPAPPSEGDLSQTSVPRLLNAFYLAQATGALTLSRGKAKKLVYVERGVPVFAASNVQLDRLGQYCVRRGLLTGDELVKLLAEAKPGERTGDVMVRRGFLSEDLRKSLVEEQVKDVIWSTFEWTEGRYAFEVRYRPRRELIKLDLLPGELILQGIRRAVPLVRLRQEVPAATVLAPRPDPAWDLAALKLSDAEARILVFADGTKSVEDLLSLSDLPEREARSFLYGCRVMGILDEARRVLASTKRIGFM